ncbi:MAG: PD-(D/E)XK nuclease family protein [Paludibacteraceae bacterium]|nr:PD-(D/E)XK nuclease family protein [Paludibacteraceae bacterium]
MLTLEKELSSLKALPLFNLSLCSKELFHSNFIAWLAENSIEFHRYFLRYLNSDDTEFHLTDLSKLRVFREKEHIDLWIQYTKNDGTKLDLIIENKVKSLPRKSQLDEYKAKYDSLNKKEGNDAKFVLLSLAKPLFTLNDWQYMSYRDLCCNVLIDISFDNAYYNALLVDYRRFICKLQQISNLLSEHFEGVKFLGDKEIKEQFKEIRMHDFYEKRKYDYVVSKLYSMKPKQFILGVNPVDLEVKDIEINKIYLSTNYYHEQGLINIKKCIKIAPKNDNCVIIGIQIQDDQIRKLVQVYDGDAIKELNVYGNWWSGTEDVGKSDLPSCLKGNVWYPGKYGKFKKGLVYRNLNYENKTDTLSLLEVCKNCVKLLEEFSI